MNNLIIATDLQQQIVKNKNVSLKAKGLYFYLLFVHDGKRFTIESLSNELKDGKTAISTALNELIDNNYLIRKKKIINNRYDGYDYIITR